jgi:TolB-like protein/tetratricopeptide (TPR) repeat protein
VAESSHAVFLSYASQDGEAAARICAALRDTGIEVWFDQSELRGGDAWDQSIRKQIKSCALFLPVISRTTHDRREGYFRLEWKLAVDRSHLMDADMPFLLPLVIDDTRDDDERVPERFREVQWTRLPGGATPAAFVERVRRLLLAEPAQGPTKTGSATGPVSSARITQKPVLTFWGTKAALLTLIVLGIAGLGYLVANRLAPKHGPEVGSAPAPRAQSAPVNAFNPPPHSIAVLPFVNMSGDKDQEYFSDGLSEELLNDLSRINELQVAGRTSSFYFKGKDVELATIVRKLNVGPVLEGSVRRSAHTVRVTAQLINAVTGFHMWSQTYDRSLGDVLKLQTEIAEAVASALQATLLGDVATKSAVGGTRNAAAHDAYLRASSGYWQQKNATDLQRVIADYEEAVRLDPRFALAYAELAHALNLYTRYAGPAVQEWIRRAQEPAQRAIALAPDLPEGHLALADFFLDSLDFTRASEEYNRAVALAPGSARVLKGYGYFAVLIGHSDVGIAALRRAVTLDPLNISNHIHLIGALRLAKRSDESLAAYRDALVFLPNSAWVQAVGVQSYYALGDFETVRALCEAELKQGNTQGDWPGWLSSAYYKLGRHADADAALESMKGIWGDAAAVGYAEIYAQRGETLKALEWLETGLRLHDTDLQYLKVEPMLDPLRNEPRFQAIERELKFPE